MRIENSVNHSNVATTQRETNYCLYSLAPLTFRWTVPLSGLKCETSFSINYANFLTRKVT